MRANLVGPVQIFDPRSQQTFNGNTGNYWFNPTSFSNTNYPAYPSYGTLPRNYFRGPLVYNIESKDENVDSILKSDSPLTPVWNPDLLGGTLFKGEGLPRQVPRGLMYLMIARDGAPQDKSVADLYATASAQATDDERAMALSFLEAWLKGRRD